MARANAECTATGKTVRHIIRKLNTHTPHLTNGSTVILPLSKYLSKRNGIYVHTKAYSFIHIGKKVDTPKLSISWWVDGQSVSHPYREILLNNKKPAVDLMSSTAWMNINSILLNKWKNLAIEGYILFHLCAFQEMIKL